jgi:SAM-dependent methyltransferase
MVIFQDFSIRPSSVIEKQSEVIYCFQSTDVNIDESTVEAFGDEWTKFNSFSQEEINSIASKHYFDIVPKEYITEKTVLDVGCGTGRWSKYISQYAKTVDAVDPSIAIESAAKLLGDCNNVRLSKATVGNLPFADNSFDFVFSLGVLHHIPDTKLALQQCVMKLKPGGYFLVYLYYRFDNRGLFFKMLFYLSAIFRKLISAMPSDLKNFVCDIIACIVYLPFVWLATMFNRFRFVSLAKKLPLFFYVGKSFHVIRNDARDRFGTPLEQRFTKLEITEMMKASGLVDIVFSDNDPYWHAIGRKA